MSTRIRSIVTYVAFWVSVLMFMQTKAVAASFIEQKIANLNKTISKCNFILSKNPNSRFTYQRRAKTYQQFGEYLKEADDYTKLISIDPQNAFTYYQDRAIAYAHMEGHDDNRKYYNKAISDCNKAISLKPTNATIYVTRSFVYSEYCFLGDDKKSLDDCNTAIRLQPNIYRFYISRAITWLNLGERSKAELDFERAISLCPKNPDIYILAARYMPGGPESIQYLTEAININPHNSWAYFYRAQMRSGISKWHKEEVDKTIADYEKSIQIVPSGECSYNAHCALAPIFEHFGDHKKAIDECMKAIAIESNDSEAHYVLIRIYEGRSEFNKALSECNKVVALNSTGIVDLQQDGKPIGAFYSLPIYSELSALELRARFHKKCGEYKNAISDYRSATKLLVDSPSVLRSLDYKIGLYNKAVDKCENHDSSDIINLF